MWPLRPTLRLSALDDAQISSLAVPGDLTACNPSIAISDEGFRCIVRTVNYCLDADGRFQLPPDGAIKSLNWLVDLDRDFRIVDRQCIDDAVFTKQQYGLPERFEDCRLFRWKDVWWFSASRITSNQPGACHMTLCRLDGARVAEFHAFQSPRNQCLDKNWMPRVQDDLLEWIYWIDPTEVVTYRGGDEIRHRRVDRVNRLRHWRGSSQCIRYRGNWLCVVHLRKVLPDSVLYEHRFVELDDDFVIRRVSRSFVFEQEGVEFCAGLCLTDEHAVLSYGVRDEQARLLRLNLSTVESLLETYLIPQHVTDGFFAFSDLMQSLFRLRWFRHPRKQFSAVLAFFRSRGPV